jgi:hypothetical protein
MIHRYRMIGVAFACLIALPAAAQQFSADTVAIGRESSPGKIYVSDGKVRMEKSSGGPGTMLLDAHANTVLVLMPQQKMYLDVSLRGGAMLQIFKSVDPNNACPQWEEMAKQAKKDVTGWSCKRVGKETVNGRSTVKYQASSPQGQTEDIWVDTSLKFMVKTQDAKGQGTEFQNIKEGAQPASLFEIPAGYKKMDVSQMMQQHGADSPPPQ